MNVGLILRRAAQSWRQLGILLIGLCLVTAFFSLAPLYVRASVQSGLRYELDALNRTAIKLTLIKPLPWQPADYQLIADQLGNLNGSLRRISRTASPIPGFDYLYGEPTYEFSPRSPYAHYAYAFSDLNQLFRVLSGRLPERLAPPFDPNRRSSSEQEQIDKGLGMYSRGEVEAVITPTVAKGTDWEIGTRFTVGYTPDQRVVVTVVGIVEPVDAADPLWLVGGARQALEGEASDFTRGGTTPFTPAFIVTEGAYTDWIAKAATPPGQNQQPNTSYQWDFQLNTDSLTADSINDARGRLATLTATLSAANPNLTIFNPLLKTLNNYADLVSKVEAPIILLAGAVLVMMLYHLVTTVNLVLEQQIGEWASLSSRGSSVMQLILLQGVTMLVLGVIGFAVGPFLAFVLLTLIAAIGPLSSATGGGVPIAGIPPSAFWLSAIAATLGVLMLTLPAIPAARRSMAQFKQMSARPPEHPFWARYFLDFILILLGIGLMARLLFFVEGDLGSTLALLRTDPAGLIRQIIDSANRSGGLADPLNLLGPAFLLTGVALLWLRIFPLLMRGLGWLVSRNNGLTATLALWNVERAPGHYGQLVLLLVGTLALGTAALALGSTRDFGAWAQAQADIGGVIRADLPTITPINLDELRSAYPLLQPSGVLRLATVNKPGRVPQTLLGIDPESFAAAQPAFRDSIQPLIGAPIATIQGLKLPSQAANFRLQVFTPAKANDRRQIVLNTLYMFAQIKDQDGAVNVVPLRTTRGDNTLIPDQWVTMQGDLSGLKGTAPFVLTGLTLAPYAPSIPVLSADIYFDDLSVTDANGGITTLEGFETATADTWQVLGGQFRLAEASRSTFAEGAHSLRVIIAVTRLANDPATNLSESDRRGAESSAFDRATIQQPVTEASIPVIMTARMAKDLGEASRRERLPLEVGMTGTLVLPLEQGEIKLPFRVAGIVPSFPTGAATAHILILNRQALLQTVNGQAKGQGRLEGINQIWFGGTVRQSPNTFAAQLPTSLPAATFTYAWDRYNALLREPLPAAVAGMLFAGFWVSLLLSLLDFGFYLVVTARRRSLGFAVLRSMGWDANNIWWLLVVEQAALVIPALVVGIFIGVVLAYVILPFLALVGGQTLQVPNLSILGLVVTLLVGFGALTLITAQWLRRMNVNQVLRLGEE